MQFNHLTILYFKFLYFKLSDWRRTKKEKIYCISTFGTSLLVLMLLWFDDNLNIIRTIHELMLWYFSTKFIKLRNLCVSLTTSQSVSPALQHTNPRRTIALNRGDEKTNLNIFYWNTIIIKMQIIDTAYAHTQTLGNNIVFCACFLRFYSIFSFFFSFQIIN